MKHCSVYLSTPISTQTQINNARHLKKLLTKWGCGVHSVDVDNAEFDEERLLFPDIFIKPINDTRYEIISCEIFIAMIDDFDTKVLWEMGCRYGEWFPQHGKPNRVCSPGALVRDDMDRSDAPAIITYSTNGTKIDPYFEESILHHCTSINSLRTYIKRLKNEGISEIKRTI